MYILGASKKSNFKKRLPGNGMSTQEESPGLLKVTQGYLFLSIS